MHESLTSPKERLSDGGVAAYRDTYSMLSFIFMHDFKCLICSFPNTGRCDRFKGTMTTNHKTMAEAREFEEILAHKQEKMARKWCLLCWAHQLGLEIKSCELEHMYKESYTVVKILQGKR